MDAEVYPLPEVGKLANRNFVSIKLQYDTSAADDQQVKSKYQLAHDIMQTYAVAQMPTYLFFSADGKIVHRAVGYLKEADFDS